MFRFNGGGGLREQLQPEGFRRGAEAFAISDPAADWSHARRVIIPNFTELCLLPAVWV